MMSNGLNTQSPDLKIRASSMLLLVSLLAAADALAAQRQQLGDGTTVKLRTMDGEIVEVEKEIAKKSKMLNEMLDGMDIDDDVDEKNIIPLPGIKKATLGKVIEYCKYIDRNEPPKIEKPLKSNQLSDAVNHWYASFVQIEQEELFELILAANFMDIKSLLELACAKVASLIKGMTIPEIRDFFNIENDFTAQEEKQIMDENRWAEESF